MPELAVIVPTLNERASLPAFTAAVEHALAGIDYEIVIVDDDSEDGTSEFVREAAQRDRRVRIIQRIGRRGLSGAVLEGMLATSARFVAVMDADMQHDERILPKMLEILRTTDAELVVGSRNAAGGSMGRFAKHRVALSRFGQNLSRLVSKAQLSDPMSGFFALRRSLLEEVAHDLSLIGFKILLDIVASARRPVRVVEVPYGFRDRLHGDSKLDASVALEYLLLLFDKVTNGWMPIAYLKFGMVGACGVALNALFLRYLLALHVPLERSQALSGAVVIAVNFFFNDAFTFRLSRLRDSSKWLGFTVFFCACAIGLVANVQACAFLNNAGLSTTFAGLAGISIGSVWNYWISSIFVWRVDRAHRRSRFRPSPSAAPSFHAGGSAQSV